MASIRERVQRSGATSWAVLWRDPDLGKQTSLTFDRESDAVTLKRILDANGQRFAIAERILQSAASQAPTVAEMLERHIDLRTKANEGTQERYRRIAAQHIVPALGGLAVDKVNEEDIIRWVQANTKAGVARKTQANWMGILSSAFKTAIRKGWCSGNPCVDVELPNEQRPGRRATFLSREEYALLEEHTPERFRLLVKTLIGTGLRFSEATALTWDDLDLTAKTPVVHVDKAWKTVEGRRFEVRSPKSEFAIRDVSITKALASELAAAPRPNDLVFTNAQGNAITNTGFHQRGWKVALEVAAKSGLRKKPRPHDLRHSHASWLLMEGVPIFIVSRRLGHASTEITTRVYGHFMPSAQQDAVAAMERALAA